MKITDLDEFSDLEDLSEEEQTELQEKNPELFLKLRENWEKFYRQLMGVDNDDE